MKRFLLALVLILTLIAPASAFVSGTDPPRGATFSAGDITIEGILFLKTTTADGSTDAIQIDDSGDAEIFAIDSDGNVDITGSISIKGPLTGYVNSTVLTNTEGTHDGGNNVAIMTDGGESFATSNYVGMTIYNNTDGSSCTVTANDGTTITCTLAGGTDDDWDTNDTWSVAPGPDQSGSLFYISSATTILHPATANYVVGYYSTAANVIKVDPQSGSMQITLNGTPTGTNGEEIDSPGAAGDFIWLHNQSATVAVTHGRSGVFIDGGAS